MGKHDKSKRGFIWSSKAWYADAAECHHEVNFGMYFDGGGSNGEMAMLWHDLNGKWVPRLECFDDAWGALHSFSDLLAKMNVLDNMNITEEQFVKMLKECGFADMTPYER